MDACLFILTVSLTTQVYMANHSTPFAALNTGDKVCVMEIQPGDWMEVHWSSSGIGHTGYLHQVSAHKETEPTAPTPYDEHGEAPPPVMFAPPPQAPPLPPAATPAPSTPQNIPPPMAMPPGRQAYRGDEPQLPHLLAMTCRPDGGIPYAVVFEDGSRIADVIGLKSQTVRPYYVFDRVDNKGNHILYVAAKRQDQGRVLYFAFDYSKLGNDESAIRVKAPNGYDARDKCFMDWGETAYE